MQDPLYPFNYAELLKGLDEDLTAALEMCTINLEVFNEVAGYFVGELQALRFNLLADQLAISDAWRVIRDRQAVLDVVLDLTTSLHLRAEMLEPDGWTQLCQYAAGAIGCFNNEHVRSEYSVLDDTNERDRFVSQEEMLQCMQSNPWVVTLFLIRQSSAVRNLIREMNDQRRRTAGAAAPVAPTPRG